MKTDPLLDPWAETVARRRKDPAIFDTRGRVLYRFGEVEELSRRNQQENESFRGIQPGEVVALQLGNHSHWPALFLACLRRQIVVLPLERTLSEQEVAAAVQICRVSGVIRDSDGQLEPISCKCPIDWKSAPPALLKLTSGTTAAPRAIRFRSSQLLADAVQICDTMGITEADLNFAVIPLSHSYGFSNLITPLLVRGVPMAVSSDRFPRAVLEDLAQTKATVFPGTPLFFQAFGEMPEVPPLPKLRLCISAGAPLTLNIARKFREKFGRAVHSFYGASECGGICYDREAKGEVEGFVGPAMERVSLESIEARAEATQLRVQSAAAGDGYFPEPDAAKLGNGSFVPDDLVTISNAGVRIVGRVSDVINVAGKKVNPAEVEAVLLSCEGVHQAVVFGRASASRHQEVAACVVATKDTTEAALREFCGARLSAWQVPRRVFFLEALPVNERGKISRRELAQDFA